MQVLFIPKEGVALYQELLSSETSRDALRFYLPVKTPAGVQISMASLGSALSLASDLRWYVRRYMRDVLFEISDGVYCTRALAQEIYCGRLAVLHTPWKFRKTCTFQAGQMISEDRISVDAGRAQAIFGTAMGETVVLEVWCTEEEFLGQKRSDEKGDEVGDDITSL